MERWRHFRNLNCKADPRLGWNHGWLKPWASWMMGKKWLKSEGYNGDTNGQDLSPHRVIIFQRALTWTQGPTQSRSCPLTSFLSPAFIPGQLQLANPTCGCWEAAGPFPSQCSCTERAFSTCQHLPHGKTRHKHHLLWAPPPKPVKMGSPCIYL